MDVTTEASTTARSSTINGTPVASTTGKYFKEFHETAIVEDTLLYFV